MEIERFRQQRGAMLLITPLVITAIALISVLIIDGARLYALRAEMQSQVNAAASAAAGASQACGGDSVSLDTMRERALAAARAQGFADSSGDLSVQAGLLEASPTAPGELAFRQTADLLRSNAALVSYSRSEPISRLLPESLLGSVVLEANAAARNEVVATISAAGSTANIEGGLLGTLLGALLGQPGYTLDPSELNSLSNTLLEVGELLDELGVDSLEAALPLSADRLAIALRDIAGVSSSVGALAEDFLGATGIETVLINDLISTVADARVPQNTQVRAYDLLISLAMNIARQQQLLSGSPLVMQGLDLSLISAISQESLTVRLYINRAPTVAIGPARQGPDGEWLTHFYAPDISLELEVDAKLPAGSLASLHIPLAIELGGGEGVLVSAECARGLGNEVHLGIEATTQTVSLGTGDIDMETGELRVSALGLKVLEGVVSLKATVQGRLTGQAAHLETRGQGYPLFCDPAIGCTRLAYRSAGDGLERMALDITVDGSELLGLDLSPLTSIIDGVTSLLESVISSLLEHLVSPLLQALGVGIGGVQVSIEAANQDGAQLIENVLILEE